MTADELKKQAAYAALDHITTGGIIGVGTGSFDYKHHAI